MTTRDAGLVGLGIVAGAALVGAGILLWNLSKGGGDEPGIRVKNGGSVHIETMSSLGFDFNMTATDCIRRDTRGCYNLTVVEGSPACAGKVLYQVKGVGFVTSDRTAHGIGFYGKKVAVKRGKGWKAKGQGNLDLSYGADTVDLVRVVAVGEDSTGNDDDIRCTFEGPTRRFELTSVDCK